MQLPVLLPMLLSSAVQAQYSIQVNYYTDGGCTAYASTPPYVPTDASCYKWAITDTNSANIANCVGFNNCSCQFYTQLGCAGEVTATAIKKGYHPNCASNWGQGYKSFRCSGF